MSQQTLTLELREAPAFIAELIKQGLTFEAKQIEDKILISFTGGF